MRETGQRNARHDHRGASDVDVRSLRPSRSGSPETIVAPGSRPHPRKASPSSKIVRPGAREVDTGLPSKFAKSVSWRSDPSRHDARMHLSPIARALGLRQAVNAPCEPRAPMGRRRTRCLISELRGAFSDLETVGPLLSEKVLQGVRRQRRRHNRQKKVVGWPRVPLRPLSAGLWILPA